MGQELSLSDYPVLCWQVKPESSLEKVEIIRNGRVVYKSNKKAGKWVDNDVSTGVNWYYLRVKEEGVHKRYPHNIAPARGKWAWSSPVWIRFQK